MVRRLWHVAILAVVAAAGMAAQAPSTDACRSRVRKCAGLYPRCSAALGRGGGDCRDRGSWLSGPPRRYRRSRPTAHAGDRPERRVRVTRFQRRARAHRQHGRAAGRGEPAGRPRAEGVHGANPRGGRRGCRRAHGSRAGSGVRTSNGPRDRPERGLWRDGRRGTVYAQPRSRRCAHTRASGLREPVRSQHVPREQRSRSSSRASPTTTPNPPNGEIVKDADRPATGVLKGSAADIVRRVIPPDSVRAAADAGPRRAEGSTRGRRDDDAGPDVGGSAARVPGIAAARRADVADHAASDAGQRHAHGRARHLARVRRRVAALHRLQGVGGRHHGQQRRDVLRAVHARSEEQGPAARHHAPRRAGRRRDGHDRRRSTTRTSRRAISRS